MKITSEELTSFLDELIKDPICELNYKMDYELLIATVLSAQSTDKRVNSVTSILFDKYDIFGLKDASLKEIENIIKPVGTYHKKAIFVKEIAKNLCLNYNGVVPNDRTYLESLPGVGRKTCNVVLSHLFSVPAIAVDTHVERVSKRLGIARKNDSVSLVEKKLMKLIPKPLWGRTHLQLVLFGRYYCKSKNPLCESCKLKDYCKKK